MAESEYLLGATSVVKVPEMDLNDFTVTQLLPNINPKVLAMHPEWIDSRTYDEETGKVFLSVHTWVVRHEGKTLLIDTGAGNDKDRPNLKVLDHLHHPYLKRLESVGVVPEKVDYILLTHIHADHVGWNTRLEGKEWVPTFPNATVICSDVEWQYGAALASGDEAAVRSIRKTAGLGYPIRLPVGGVFNDSMQPIEAAGRLKRVAIDGSEILPGIRFLPTPGHSICHAAISVSSKGEEAIFGGDVVHHPFELHDPDLTSMFCEFPDAARASRRQLASQVADSGAPYFSSHFPATSVGKILRDGDAFRWEFEE